MPFKDSEKRKKCRHRYYLKHREEILSKNKEYREKNRERHLEQKKIYYNSLKLRVRELLGIKCIICGKSDKKINYHEIHGKKHRYSPIYILKNPKDFVCLCEWCHNAIHQIARNIDNVEKIMKLAEKIKRGIK